MSGIHGQRSQQREDVGDKFIPQQLLLILVKLGIAANPYIPGFQQAMQLPVNPVLLAVNIAHNDLAFTELLQWCPAVNRGGADTGSDLLLQSANAFHEEFIEIAADDSKKLDAFQSRGGIVCSHVQYAIVEFQPRQFPVQVEFRTIEVDPCRRFCACCSSRFSCRPGAACGRFFAGLRGGGSAFGSRCGSPASGGWFIHFSVISHGLITDATSF